MTEKGIHYRTGGKLTHAGCEMLPNGKDIPYIVIDHIEYKEEEFVSGRKETNTWVAYFKSNPYTKLPIILNATNRKRIGKLAKTPYINLVKDFPVRLTQEETRDIQDGGNMMGLRISKIPATQPQPKPKKVESSKTPLTEDKMESAKKYIKDHTIAELENFYVIPDDMMETLKKYKDEIKK